MRIVSSSCLTMATELSSFSITQHQKIAKAQDSHDSWNLHSQHPMEEDDSWEVQAFAEDISNVMGATWPPRSYTCTFCRREFRSAQALGGHMNVHRRDRARLHQSSTSPRILHRFHHNTSVQVPPTTGNFSSGSGLTPYGQYFHEIEPENWTFSCEKENNHHYGREAERNWRTEEVDLELRLGHRPSPE